MIVLDCLKMPNEKDVSVIYTKLLLSLHDSVDVYLPTQLADKFAPDTI